MVQKSLNDVPYEVYLDYIIQYIGFKEVGCLTLTSKTLKEIFDEDNAIWKYLYMKTTRPKIISTSVHIGPHSRTVYDKYDYYIKNGHREKGGCLSEKEPKYWSFENTIYQNAGGGSSYCCCREISNLIQPMYNIRNDPNLKCIPVGLNINFGFGIDDQPKEVKDEYYDYIKNIHIKYLESRGLSTKKLCQNIKHYDFNTLGNVGNTASFKSFKKQTLEKLKTDRKNKFKMYEGRYSKKLKTIQNAKNKLEQLEKEAIEIKTEKEKYEKFIKKSTTALECINIKNAIEESRKSKVGLDYDDKGNLIKDWKAKYSFKEKLWFYWTERKNIKSKSTWIRPSETTNGYFNIYKLKKDIYCMVCPPEGVIGKTLTFTDKIRYNVTLKEGTPDEDIIIYINKKDVKDIKEWKIILTPIEVLKAKFI
tara:strand:- start:12901 stop:14160 length:1260 start_codon:yes stop_codon:yes gene_type:complete